MGKREEERVKYELLDHGYEVCLHGAPDMLVYRNDVDGRATSYCFLETKKDGDGESTSQEEWNNAMRAIGLPINVSTYGGAIRKIETGRIDLGFKPIPALPLLDALHRLVVRETSVAVERGRHPEDAAKYFYDRLTAEARALYPHVSHVIHDTFEAFWAECVLKANAEFSWCGSTDSRLWFYFRKGTRHVLEDFLAAWIEKKFLSDAGWSGARGPRERVFVYKINCSNPTTQDRARFAQDVLRRMGRDLSRFVDGSIDVEMTKNAVIVTVEATEKERSGVVVGFNSRAA